MARGRTHTQEINVSRNSAGGEKEGGRKRDRGGGE